MKPKNATSTDRTKRKKPYSGKPLGLKTPKMRVVMDGTDWLYECGSAIDGNTVYPDKKSLLEHSGHDLSECGIAEVEIRFVRWIKEPTK